MKVLVNLHYIHVLVLEVGNLRVQIFDAVGNFVTGK